MKILSIAKKLLAIFRNHILLCTFSTLLSLLTPKKRTKLPVYNFMFEDNSIGICNFVFEIKRKLFSQLEIPSPAVLFKQINLPQLLLNFCKLPGI